MNQYLLLLFLSAIFLLLSIYTEKKTLLTKNAHKLLLFRYIHFFFFIYFAIFLLLFNVNDTINVYVYLIITLGMMVHWQYFGCCLLSLFELNSYSLTKPLTYELTTNHPTMRSIFKKSTDTVMNLLGAILFINVSYILYNSKVINKFIKGALTIIFFILFGLTMVDRGEQKYDEKTVEYFKKI